MTRKIRKALLVQIMVLVLLANPILLGFAHSNDASKESASGITFKPYWGASG